MTGIEQSKKFLRQYISAKQLHPWVAEHAQERAIRALNHLGGIEGSWRTDYGLCTYYAPQKLNGRLVDLSTVEKVREYHEQ